MQSKLRGGSTNPNAYNQFFNDSWKKPRPHVLPNAIRIHTKEIIRAQAGVEPTTLGLGNVTFQVPEIVLYHLPPCTRKSVGNLQISGRLTHHWNVIFLIYFLHVSCTRKFPLLVQCYTALAGSNTPLHCTALHYIRVRYCVQGIDGI